MQLLCFTITNKSSHVHASYSERDGEQDAEEVDDDESLAIQVDPDQQNVKRGVGQSVKTTTPGPARRGPRWVKMVELYSYFRGRSFKPNPLVPD